MQNDPGEKLIWRRQKYQSTAKPRENVPVTFIAQMAHWSKVQIDETGRIVCVDPNNLRKIQNERLDAAR